jgi:hypothetical protein
VFWLCEEGDDDAFRVGVAISIGEVVCIVIWSGASTLSKVGGVVGCEFEEGGESWSWSMSECQSPGVGLGLRSSAIKSSLSPKGTMATLDLDEWPENQSNVRLMWPSATNAIQVGWTDCDLIMEHTVSK